MCLKFVCLDAFFAISMLILVKIKTIRSFYGANAFFIFTEAALRNAGVYSGKALKFHSLHLKIDTLLRAELML